MRQAFVKLSHASSLNFPNNPLQFVMMFFQICQAQRLLVAFGKTSLIALRSAVCLSVKKTGGAKPQGHTRAQSWRIAHRYEWSFSDSKKQNAIEKVLLVADWPTMWSRGRSNLLVR